MQVYASCAALNGAGVLLIGPSGSGKSDLLLRLLDRGFILVADDRVEIESGIARPPGVLAGLLEVRGIGIVRLPFQSSARIVLAAALSKDERLPQPAVYAGWPLIHVDAFAASAPDRIALALRCALGEVGMLAGAFA